MNTPTVSVIIPTYNRGHMIGEAIKSVLSQTYWDLELIVVDDGSTDNTAEVVRLFHDDRLRYIKLKERSGASSVPRNTGLRVATGEYIALLDSDDEWMPNKLELEVKYLNTYPSVGLVYSNYTYFGSREGYRKSGFEGARLPHTLTGLFLDNPISSSAALIRRACFDKVGYFDESVVQSGDFDMWLRIAKDFVIDYINTPLARYRLHDRNRHLNTEPSLVGEIAVRRKCLEANPFLLEAIGSKAMHHQLYRKYRALGNWYLNTGNLREARGPFREYARVYPLNPVAWISWLITFLPWRAVSRFLTCKRKLGVNL